MKCEKKQYIQNNLHETKSFLERKSDLSKEKMSKPKRRKTKLSFTQ